ncbi:MAG TPA: gephyrin-like molybdotransferase receptor GlpR [Pseudonocardiaceae bacterium]|jgi:hypothetical protein|nr:gephyrin-like molybdotransferase receptor GlpR [Pseudonocardiaceae bacterium]
MPSSLIIVALVVAWLLVLVPIVARRRQEVARTADSTLAARVVRSGGVRSTAEEDFTMAEAGETDTVLADEYEADEYASPSGAESDSDRYSSEDDDYEEYSEYDEYDDYEDSGPRPYRPGRGGFDPEAAALTARARYAFRQRVVVLMLMAALVSGLVAGLLSPMVWWIHAMIDIGLVGYLGYLRRQVRIEEEIRERRTARMGSQRRVHAPARPAHGDHDAHGPDLDDLDADLDADADLADRFVDRPEVTPVRRPVARYVHPGTVVVETDDEDPMFAELEEPGAQRYRRAVGE